MDLRMPSSKTSQSGIAAIEGLGTHRAGIFRISTKATVTSLVPVAVLDASGRNHSTTAIAFPKSRQSENDTIAKIGWSLR